MEKSNIIIEEESPEMRQFTEMSINVFDSLPTEVENSIFYPKLKQLLHLEINRFCREQVELKEDLQILRRMVGEVMEETAIRDYLEGLKEKYNNKTETNCGLQFHIESTKIDFGVCCFVVIKRKNVEMKKFVFRFRKSGGLATPLIGLTTGGLLDI